MEHSPTRKLVKTGVALLALNGCDQQPSITNGKVYQKEYSEIKQGVVAIGKFAQSYGHRETVREEIGLSRPIHDGKETLAILPYPYRHSKTWTVSIEQCPTLEPRPVERIKEECPTATFIVPEKVFNKLQLGKYAEFKQSE